ncbi:MAG: HD domain-containing phosphohydrolase [Syntrophales bacterium]|jgi:response regulator RpfG family c-di-GMP phosphodiesterase
MVHAFGIDNITPYKKKILVVDDYVPTRQMIVDALSDSGYQTIKEAGNGREALGIFRNEHYDLVISDVMMPQMGGMELLQHLKEINPDTAVIMITAQPEVELTVSALKKGAVDFLKKPFNIEDLMYKVHVYLQESNITTPQSYQSDLLLKQIEEKTNELSIHSYIYDSVENIEGNHDEIFEKLATTAMRVVDGEECFLLIYDDESKEFHAQVSKSLTNSFNSKLTILSLKYLYHQVVEKGDALMIHSQDHPFVAPSLICSPLMIRDKTFGVLSIRKKKDRGPFAQKDLNYLVSLCKRASLNLENKMLYESLYVNVLDTFKALIASIQVRDQYTEDHSLRVTKFAVRLAREMGCTTGEIESLKIAGSLHDLGKVAIPDNVLLKPDRLTNEEYEIVKQHPDTGERILKPVAIFERERTIIRHHHERWDGRGYPAGLSGEDIPILARILAMTDTFDAITNNRPYRQAQSVEAAVAEIKKNRGTQFDPLVTDHFLKIL